MVGYQGSQEPEQWVGTRNQCVVQRGATGAPLGDHWPIYLVDIFSRAQRVTHGLTSAPRPGGGAPGAELSSALRQHKIESIRNVIIANFTIVLWFVKTGKSQRADRKQTKTSKLGNNSKQCKSLYRPYHVTNPSLSAHQTLDI